ncbi:MAG: PucR family transcriptional regulator [Clostridiales bacterium]|nr:PucR family transcriptional regulator [Clostridiales bacterium]
MQQQQQPPELRQVLAKYPLSMAHVLTGAEGLDTPVTKFGVLDAPDATMFVQEHELVVTSGFIFSNNEALLLDVVKQLIHKKAAAFGVKLERKYVNIPASILEYAQQHSFAIISLPVSITWYELASILFSFGVDQPAKASDNNFRQKNIYNTVEYFFSSMKNLVDISQIPTLIHEFFGLTCLIYNINNGNVVSCPENYTLSGDIDTTIREFEVRNANIENSSELYRHYLMNGQSLLVSTLAFNNVYFGHIIIVESPDQILDDDTLEESLRYILLMIRLRCRDVFELTRNDLVIRNNLILDFISHPHEGKDIVRIQALANEYGLVLQNVNYLVQFSPDVKNVTDLNPQHKITSAVLEIIPKLYNLYSAICGWKNDNLFFCIIPYKDEAHGKRLLSKITGYIQSRIPEANLKFGVSLPTDVNNTNMGYVQAGAALRVCKDNDLSQNVTFFDPFDLRNFLTEPQFIRHFNNYYEKYLKPIEEYDSTHDGTLMKTLRMYFEKNREIKACADALFVHHNTIRYRLEQISQIAGIDFSDRNTTMMLSLCTMIYPFLDRS